MGAAWSTQHGAELCRAVTWPSGGHVEYGCARACVCLSVSLSECVSMSARTCACLSVCEDVVCPGVCLCVCPSMCATVSECAPEDVCLSVSECA